MRIIVVCKIKTVTLPSHTDSTEPARKFHASPGTPPDSVRTLSSTDLLDGRHAVEIQHLGTRYVLRATRSGKLILTK